MAIAHLPGAGYRRMPWKNGAGTTSEIAVFPAGAGLEEFAWRLAIADLDRSAGFSTFPGIDRLLMVLPPGGVALTIDGTEREMPPFEVVRFAGESAVSATLASAPAKDLNLMLRRGVASGTMAPATFDGEMWFEPEGRQTVVCAIDGAVEVEHGAGSVTLSPGDSARVEASEGVGTGIQLSSPGRAVVAIVSIRTDAETSCLHGRADV